MKKLECCIVLVSVFISVMIANCSAPVAGVETTNGATVVMSADHVEGTSPPFASVYIFDTSYIPFVDTGLGVATASDEDGFFSIQQIDAKVINVQIVDNSNKNTGFVAVDADGKLYKSELRHAGTLRGNVEMPGTGKVMVFICGSDYYTFADENGAFSLKGVPPASYKVQAVLLSQTGSGTGQHIISSSAKILVMVNSDEVTVLNETINFP
jgi:hypothetical protein